MGRPPKKREPFIGPLEVGTKMIPLTRGQYAKVDEEDYEWLSESNWYAWRHSDTTNWYAISSRTNKKMHQVITGRQWEQVDHINHDTLDNRKSNLRDGSKHNLKNQRPRAGGTSQYKGVSWFPRTQKWRAVIHVDGKFISLGYFEGTPQGEIEAAATYDEASLKYHGEYGLRNFPWKENT
jgi:hypothetical protein